MGWLNDLPSVKGIDRFVVEMAQRLMSGPVTFKSPYWDGDVTIGTLGEYRAWIRVVERIENKQDAERRALEIWDEEKMVGNENKYIDGC
jgi:hypothetical protein